MSRLDLKTMRVRTAGTSDGYGDLIVTTNALSNCGKIRAGLGFRFEHHRGGFVVDYDDLRAAFIAAEQYRASLTPEQLSAAYDGRGWLPQDEAEKL